MFQLFFPDCKMFYSVQTLTQHWLNTDSTLTQHWFNTDSTLTQHWLNLSLTACLGGTTSLRDWCNLDLLWWIHLDLRCLVGELTRTRTTLTGGIQLCIPSVIECLNFPIFKMVSFCCILDKQFYVSAWLNFHPRDDLKFGPYLEILLILFPLWMLHKLCHPVLIEVMIDLSCPVSLCFEDSASSPTLSPKQQSCKLGSRILLDTFKVRTLGCSSVSIILHLGDI